MKVSNTNVILNGKYFVSEAYLRPSQKAMMCPFCENSSQLLDVWQSPKCVCANSQYFPEVFIIEYQPAGENLDSSHDKSYLQVSLNYV